MLQRAALNDDPFAIFLWTGSRNWSMRCALNGKQIKTSLRTEDEAEARRRANRIWHEQSLKLEQGLSLNQLPFQDVAEEFAAKVVDEVLHRERSADHQTFWLQKIRRFFITYFAERPIDKITAADIE